jgi:hypothetical protein
MILRAIILPCLFPPLGGFFEPATREEEEGGGGGARLTIKNESNLML